MEDKKPYRINENALREKLLNYRVNFNPSCLELLENEVAHVKTHAALELPDTKKLVRFILIPIVLIGLGCAGFFTFTYIKNLPSKDQPDSTLIAKPAVKPEIKEQPKAVIEPKVKDALRAMDKKQDTIFPTVVPQKIKTPAKTPVQQKIAAPKKDTTSVNNTNSVQLDSVKKKSKVDTATVQKNKDISGKKKKRRHKNSLDATEDIRQSVPNNADDDVVVPEN